MPDLLVEIGLEELPAMAVEPAMTFLRDGFVSKARAQRLATGTATVLATPRRLTLLVRDAVIARYIDATWFKLSFLLPGIN